MATIINWSQVVKDILEEKAISQAKLGAVCGCTQQTISNILNGARDPGVGLRRDLRAFLDELEIPLEDYEEEVEDFLLRDDIKKMLKLLKAADKVKQAQAVATVTALLT